MKYSKKLNSKSFSIFCLKLENAKDKSKSTVKQCSFWDGKWTTNSMKEKSVNDCRVLDTEIQIQRKTVNASEFAFWTLCCLMSVQTASLFVCFNTVLNLGVWLNKWCGGVILFNCLLKKIFIECLSFFFNFYILQWTLMCNWLSPHLFSLVDEIVCCKLQ